MHNVFAVQLELATAAGEDANHHMVQLQQQVESLSDALEANNLDRQQLAGQRDAWMGSYQSAASKLQELAAVSEASQRALIARAEALAKGVEAVVRQAGEATEAAAGGVKAAAVANARPASSGRNGGTGAAGGVGGGIGAGGGGGVATGEALAVMVAASQSVAGQLAGLQELMGREVQKQQEMYMEAMQVRQRRKKGRDMKGKEA